MRFGATLRRLRAEAFELSGLNARDRRSLDGSCAAILAYHRILPVESAERWAIEPAMYVTPGSFANHLEWLRASFCVLPLGEIVDRLRQGKPLPNRACAITFDDGWRDNYTFAFPELSRRGLPATVFIVHGRVGSSGAFCPDEVSRRMGHLAPGQQREFAERVGAGSEVFPQGVLPKLKRLPEEQLFRALEFLRLLTPEVTLGKERELLDWEEVATMSAGGIDFESHGCSHAMLTNIPLEEAARELAESREQLCARGYGRYDLFAYPFGQHSSSIRDLVRDTGYRAAFTVRRGLATSASDPLAIPRLCLHEDVSASRSEFHRQVPGLALRP